MTLARIQATGRGRLAARLSIDGQAREWVSSKALEQTIADGRIRTIGLDLGSLRFGARADLARATLEGETCQVTIEDLGKKATGVFSKRPQASTYLSASLTTSATTVTVLDTTAFASSGVVYIGTEAIKYTGKTGTTFTTCTRGHWGTVAQAHFVADGAGLLSARVTDVPQSLEGQRARLYFYGDGDSVTGDGTVVHLGICTTGAKYGSGKWEFTLDPLTRLLDQPIGRDLSEPIPIRGIYYPTNAPLVLAIRNHTSLVIAWVKHTGFAETQEAFCSALSTTIATAIAATAGWTWGTGASLIAQPSGMRADSWELVYQAGTGGSLTALDVSMLSDIDTSVYDAPDVWLDDSGVGTTTPTSGQRVRRPYLGTVPRATVGAYGRGLTRPGDTSGVSPSDASASPRRIYLGGLVVPTVNMMLSFEAAEAGSSDAAVAPPMPITTVDTTNRYVEIDAGFTVLTSESRFKAGRYLTTGTIETLRSFLATNSASYCNAGAMPLVDVFDIVQNSTDVTDAAGETRLGTDRVFAAFDEITLGDIFANELLVLGCYMRINAGTIELARMRPSLTVDTADWTIGADDIAGWTSLERGRYGTISRVLYRTGWNAIEDKHEGTPWEVVDVSASSPNRAAGVVEIAQRSYPQSRTSADTRSAEASQDEVVRLAMPILGLFGSEYDTLTISVGMRFFGARIGQTVSLTSTLIPATDGTMGVTSEICLITGHSFDGSTKRIQLELLRHGQRFAGYAPGFRVTSYALVSGNTYDLTVNLTDYTTASTIATWLAAADVIRVTEAAVAAPTQLGGSVVSIQSATVVRVTFTGAWTPGTSEWVLRAADAGSYVSTANLARFCFEASTAARIAWSGSGADSQVFA